jgi:hypothetical protein
VFSVRTGRGGRSRPSPSRARRGRHAAATDGLHPAAQILHGGPVVHLQQLQATGDPSREWPGVPTRLWESARPARSLLCWNGHCARRTDGPTRNAALPFPLRSARDKPRPLAYNEEGKARIGGGTKHAGQMAFDDSGRWHLGDGHWDGLGTGWSAAWFREARRRSKSWGG